MAQPTVCLRITLIHHSNISITNDVNLGRDHLFVHPMEDRRERSGNLSENVIIFPISFGDSNGTKK